MEVKLSVVEWNDLLKTLIISARNVCKTKHVMEMVLLDVGILLKKGICLHGTDRVQQCPPLELEFKPSLIVMNEQE